MHDIEFPGGAGRWEIRRRTFWQGGEPHELVVLSDVSQPLREQERQAWQRLIRVIGHELNNSLAPIKSIAGSLAALLRRTPPPADWREDMERGLTVIESRADALESLHDRVRATGSTAGAAAAADRLLHRSCAASSRSRRGCRSAVSSGPDVDDRRPTPTSSSSC